jgi:hypothetical protein
MAQTTATYQMSANIPAATGVNLNLYYVLTADANATWHQVTTDTMDFGTLSLLGSGIYASDRYFFLDITPSGGAGNPTVTFNYTEDPNNPNAVAADGRHGLGYKTNVSFMKVDYKSNPNGTVTFLTSHPAKEKLANVVNETITPTDVSGGNLRVYFGLNTGASGEPQNSELFTNNDASGSYTGTLTVSATLS